MATNGQMWIGTTAVNAGGTHINVGAITSPLGTLNIGYSSPNITMDLVGGGISVEHLTGNSGGQLNPDGSNNFNILTANSTVKFAGSGSTLTQDFGISNLVLGSSLPSLTTGIRNIGLGESNLNAVTSGQGNTAIGWNAGLVLNTGSDNTLIGFDAGAGLLGAALNTFVGGISGRNVTTGTGNTAIGYGSLQNLMTGINNVVVGSGAVTGSAYNGAETANILIAASGTAGESNTIRIGIQGSANTQQNQCFIAGIVGVTNSNAQAVTIDSTSGQLGVTSAASSKTTIYNLVDSGSSWSIDSRTKFVDFWIMSGGGGGGSGRCGGTGSSGGGAGGGAGALMYTRSLASQLLASPYIITVGDGGIGGASINATTTNGNPGNPGGTSSLGSVFIVSATNGGGAGISGTSTGGSSVFCQAPFGSTPVVNGGSGSSGLSPADVVAKVLLWASPGGGAAGPSTGTPKVGGAAGSITDAASNILAAGGLAGANTGATAGNGNTVTGTAYMFQGGTGGGGGGHDGATTAGSGGNGATPGGGGGGGAGNISLNPSGAGGKGGAGKIIIIEYF